MKTWKFWPLAAMATGCALGAFAETITLTDGGSRCVIDTQGGWIRSCVLDGEDVLWQSPEEQDRSAPWVHGGLPIAWPWFGRQGEGDGHIHGYAWKNAFEVASRTANEAVLTFDAGAVRLTYAIRLGRSLSLSLKTENRSAFAFPMSVAFHPYFRVGERDRVTVEGLHPEPVACTNAVDAGASFERPSPRREYRICDAALGRTLRIVAENSTGANLWNPGAEKDCPGAIPGDEWRRFVAVEPVAKAGKRLMVLDPGESHSLKMSVSVVPADAAPVTLVPAPREFVPEKGEYVVKLPKGPQAYREIDLLRAGVAAAKVTYETDAALPAEGYRLKVSADGVVVASADPAGRFYALVTLEQLAALRGKDAVAFPCCTVRDFPRYRWRGMMIDEARHFLGKTAVLRVLDLMAMHKLNVLHWHLVDDQGWRLEIKRHPELVKYGAVRPRSVKYGAVASWPNGKLHYELDNEKYGPFFYTHEDVKEILAYAKARHVTVVPEIELPGHVRALLAAHPECSCKGDLERVPRIYWSIEDDVLCIGNDAAVELLEDVFDEVCELFPETPYVHIGGDECPLVRWKTCPKCQARMRAEGMKDESGLQAWITSRIARYLEAKGRRAVGWDEILAGDVPTSAIGMTWRMSQKGGAGTAFVSAAEATVRGHDMVMTPNALCYLSYRQFEKGDPHPYYSPWAKPLSMERIYTAFDPLAGIPEAARKHVIGGQASVWGEAVWTLFDLEWKTWPRACAIAEILWTAPAVRDYGAFRRRMARHRERLLDAQVNCAPLD